MPEDGSTVGSCVACNVDVCNGIVCDAVICNGIVCNGIVCNGIVCDAVICNGTACCDVVGCIICEVVRSSAKCSCVVVYINAKLPSIYFDPMSD